MLLPNIRAVMRLQRCNAVHQQPTIRLPTPSLFPPPPNSVPKTKSKNGAHVDNKRRSHRRACICARVVLQIVAAARCVVMACHVRMGLR